MLLRRSDLFRDRYIFPTTAGPSPRLGLAHSITSLAHPGDLHINCSLFVINYFPRLIQ